MCIIVAKNKGVKMPSIETLSNCFTTNKDGAGIMLACGGLVHGFKGLMTFKEFTDKLAELEAHYGSLDQFSVVMHFRIGTHGTNIAANTHPFPVSDRYDDLRKTAWTDVQGVAHNGIITECGYHSDVKKENVSDTMVFVKRVIAPIARFVRITDSPEILEALELAAGSKLAFLSGDGNLAIAGHFEEEDGVFYSNSSYTGYKKKPLSNFKFDSFCFDDDEYTKTPFVSSATIELMKQEYAEELGLIVLHPDTLIMSEGVQLYADGEFALCNSTGSLWLWDDYSYEWYECYGEDEYVFCTTEEESEAFDNA